MGAQVLYKSEVEHVSPTRLIQGMVQFTASGKLLMPVGQEVYCSKLGLSTRFWAFVLAGKARVNAIKRIGKELFIVNLGRPNLRNHLWFLNDLLRDGDSYERKILRYNS